MTSYTWRRGGVLTADGRPRGVLDRNWKRSSATFETDGATWDFVWAETRRRRELRRRDEILVVATGTARLWDRWQFEGELVCDATPKRLFSHALALRDAHGRFGTISEPRVLMTGVRLRSDRELPAHHAAFLLWVLESDARKRFNLLDLAARAGS